MTGRDLIIYILQNGLENKEIFADGTFLDLMPASEAAAKFGVGTFTILAWYRRGYLQGVELCDSVYILRGSEDPRGKFIKEK